MQFMDTHIHLPDYNANNTTEIIRAAEMAGVNRFICVSATEDEWPGVLELAAAYPGIIVPALGLHPWYLEQTEDGWEKRLEESLKQNPQALVGECGFDRLKNPDFGRQKLFFELQLSLARKYRRSLLIHAVKAAEWLEGFWGILPERSVFHAFGGRTEMLKKVLNSGAYAAFGFSIFQNRDGAEILKTIPAERMLFETDSPYMAEIRGEENQPRLLPKIALKIAEIRGDDPERLAAQVYENSLKIAGLK